MQGTDHLQILVQHLIKITVLRTGFRQNHGQMQAHRPHIEAPHKDRPVLFIRRFHPASLIPGAQECPASHGTDDSLILLIHFRNISFAQRQPVRIHGSGGTFDPCLEDILTAFSLSMNRLVIQEDNLREEHRLFRPRLPLSFLMHLQKRDVAHFRKAFLPKPHGHGHKGIVASGGAHRIQLVLDPLPALIKISADLLHGVDLRLLLHALPVRIRIGEKFLLIFGIALLGIGSQYLVHLRHRKAAILLSRRTQDDISHDVKRRVQRLRLIVPHISHLKPAA